MQGWDGGWHPVGTGQGAVATAILLTITIIVVDAVISIVRCVHYAKKSVA